MPKIEKDCSISLYYNQKKITEAGLTEFIKKEYTKAYRALGQVPFDSLAKPLAEHAKAVVLTGASRDKIAAALNDSDDFRASGVPVYNTPNFTDAIDAARDAAEVGDIVILSPACTSFDAFPNFEVRGNTFKKHVLDYK